MTGRILITGKSGQFGTELANLGGERIEAVGRPEFDFDKPETIEATFRAANPWLVVNAAAYTAVDAAETDATAAYRANRDGPAELARLCAAAGTPLIQVSTDFVFEGKKTAAYIESDPVGPISVYGASKLAGEQAVLASGAQATILRTSWVYAATGKNFVRTMLVRGQTQDIMRIVADQHGCPTAAADLAAAILVIAARINAAGWNDAYAGIFHAAGSGETTWHGLAKAVFEEALRHGTRVPRSVEAITTLEYPTPARRPANSRLHCARLEAVFGIRLPDWRTSLARTIDEFFGV
jgi:dTDP-4-dehydrorhamnose reductase